jgi:hypothetical protein
MSRVFIIFLPIWLLAQTLTFNIRSEYPYVVSLSFYSQNRDKIWPSKDSVYLLKDSLTHTFKIECQEGEIVCFGAWVRNEQTQYWGVGYEGKQYCSSCCYRCNGASTPIIELKNEDDLNY